MLPDDQTRELERLLDFAIRNMGLEYVADHLEISVQEVELRWNRQIDWTEELADRMPGMLEHMSSLDIYPGPPPGEPGTGEDPAPAETAAEVADPQARGPAEAGPAAAQAVSVGGAGGPQGTDEAAPPPGMPPGYSFERLKHAYAIAQYRSLANTTLSKEETRDWHLVQIILQATALLTYGLSVTSGRSVSPDQEMTVLNRLAGQFRSSANPGRTDAIRAKLDDAYSGRF